MANTVAAVFTDDSHAQDAVSELLVSGFTRDQIHTSTQTGTVPNEADYVYELQKETGMDDFFRSLAEMFTDYDELTTYADMAKIGHTVLMVHTDSKERIDRAEEVINRHSPLDVEEYEAQSENRSASGAHGTDAAVAPAAETDMKSASRKNRHIRESRGVRVFPRINIRLRHGAASPDERRPASYRGKEGSRPMDSGKSGG